MAGSSHLSTESSKGYLKTGIGGSVIKLESHSSLLLCLKYQVVYSGKLMLKGSSVQLSTMLLSLLPAILLCDSVEEYPAQPFTCVCALKNEVYNKSCYSYSVRCKLLGRVF